MKPQIMGWQSNRLDQTHNLDLAADRQPNRYIISQFLQAATNSVKAVKAFYIKYRNIR